MLNGLKLFSLSSPFGWSIMVTHTPDVSQMAHYFLCVLNYFWLKCALCRVIFGRRPHTATHPHLPPAERYIMSGRNGSDLFVHSSLWPCPAFPKMKNKQTSAWWCDEWVKGGKKKVPQLWAALRSRTIPIASPSITPTLVIPITCRSPTQWSSSYNVEEPGRVKTLLFFFSNFTASFFWGGVTYIKSEVAQSWFNREFIPMYSW